MPFGFGGSKTALQLTLDKREYSAGDTVRATVNVGGSIDDKAQGTRIEILYANHYKRWGRDSDGDREIDEYTDDIVGASRPFSEGTTVELGERTVEVAIPADAPPSARGLVDWKVKAVIDRRRTGDVTSEVPIQVASRPDQYAAWAERPATVERGCEMELRVRGRSYALGSMISGTLFLRATEGFDANEIRVDLLRDRLDSPGNNEVTSTDKVRSVRLAGDTKLAAGDTSELPFQIEIPADQPPSFQAASNSMRWFLEGVASRRLRDDFNIRAELNVHGAQAAKT